MAKIKGLSRVIKNLNKEVAKVKKKSFSGILKLGFEIKRRSQQNSPVLLANLKASHYVAWQGGSTPNPAWNPDAEDPKKMAKLVSRHASLVTDASVNSKKEKEVRVGVSAFYAGIQHENMEFHHTVGGPKFMEKAIHSIIPQAAKIVADKAKIR